MLSRADAALSLRPVQPPFSGLSPTLLLRRRAQMRPRSRATAGSAPGSIHVTPLFWTIAYIHIVRPSLWQVCGSSHGTSPLKSSEVTRRTLLRGAKTSSSPRTQNFASPQHLLCLSLALYRVPLPEAEGVSPAVGVVRARAGAPLCEYTPYIDTSRTRSTREAELSVPPRRMQDRRNSSTPSRPMKQLEFVQLRAATIGIPSAAVRLRTADGSEKISRSGYSSAQRCWEPFSKPFPKPFPKGPPAQLLRL